MKDLASKTTAGWYGKLPALGDFASRRLPDSFIRPWDAWIAEGLAQTHRDLGATAKDALLTFPVWRFVLPRRLIEDQAWLGVMLPSVDRVGRCFPLTLATPIAQGLHLPQPQTRLPGLKTLHAALQPLVEAALQVFDDDDLERYDAVIQQADTRLLHHEAQGLPAKAASLEALLGDIGASLATSHLAGESLWWTGEMPDTTQGASPAHLFRWPGALNQALFARLVAG